MTVFLTRFHGPFQSASKIKSQVESWRCLNLNDVYFIYDAWIDPSILWINITEVFVFARVVRGPWPFSAQKRSVSRSRNVETSISEFVFRWKTLSNNWRYSLDHVPQKIADILDMRHPPWWLHWPRGTFEHNQVGSKTRKLRVKKHNPFTSGL